MASQKLDKCFNSVKEEIMKIINTLFIVLGLLTVVVLPSFAAGLSINVINGTVDKVNAGQKLIVVNGRSYKYQLDEENSLFSYSESDKPAIKLRDVKVGQRYYLELISKKSDAKNVDYKIVRYISSQSLEETDEFSRDEK